MTEWIWTKETWSKAQKGIELDTESWASANKNMLSFHLLSTRGCKGRPQHPKTLQQRALATGCHWMPRAHKTCNTFQRAHGMAHGMMWQVPQKIPCPKTCLSIPSPHQRETPNDEWWASVHVKSGLAGLSNQTGSLVSKKRALQHIAAKQPKKMHIISMPHLRMKPATEAFLWTNFIAGGVLCPFKYHGKEFTKKRRW